MMYASSPSVLLGIMPYAMKQTQPIDKLQAIEAVRGRKRPHYTVVRLSCIGLYV